MNYTLLNRDDLPRVGNTYEFEGAQYPNTSVSFIWVDMKPGDAIRLHKHPYEEIFIIQEDSSTFTVGKETVEAQAGNIVIVSGNVPHKFVNSGNVQLKQVDIYVSKDISTEWLED